MCGTRSLLSNLIYLLTWLPGRRRSFLELGIALALAMRWDPGVHPESTRCTPIPLLRGHFPLAAPRGAKASPDKASGGWNRRALLTTQRLLAEGQGELGHLKMTIRLDQSGTGSMRRIGSKKSASQRNPLVSGQWGRQTTITKGPASHFDMSTSHNCPAFVVRFAFAPPVVVRRATQRGDPVIQRIQGYQVHPFRSGQTLMQDQNVKTTLHQTTGPDPIVEFNQAHTSRPKRDQQRGKAILLSHKNPIDYSIP